MTLYLIAHKVRGEPAFDVAVKMEMPDGPWWIIPTSGRRAYPYFDVLLSEFYLGGEIQVTKMLPEPPADLRDHYDVSRETPARDYTDRATQTHTIPTLEDI